MACVMGGNDCWAGQRGLPRAHGDLASVGGFEAALRAADEEGVEWLTLVAPSENGARAEGEDDVLAYFLARHLLGEALRRLHGEGVRLRLLGVTDLRIPEEVRHRLLDAEDLTRGNTRRHVTIAFGDDGRNAILDAARHLLASGVRADTVTADTFPRYLPCPDLPDVDLFVRTGGRRRISNLLLWHCAHAELVFLDVAWPDFRADHLRYAVDLYRRRHCDRGAADPAFRATTPDVSAPPFGAGPPAGTGLPGDGDGSLLPRLLRLPGALATHLGLVLLDGLQETSGHTGSQAKR